MNSQVALILVFTAMTMPSTVFIPTGFMHTIPKGLNDAGRIDGAHNPGIYRHSAHADFLGVFIQIFHQRYDFRCNQMTFNFTNILKKSSVSTIINLNLQQNLLRECVLSEGGIEETFMEDRLLDPGYACETPDFLTECTDWNSGNLQDKLAGHSLFLQTFPHSPSPCRLTAQAFAWSLNKGRNIHYAFFPAWDMEFWLIHIDSACVCITNLAFGK